MIVAGAAAVSRSLSGGQTDHEKLHAALMLLTLAGCATVPSPRSRDAEPVRLETPAGTFLVHPNNAEDFSKLLAGEPTEKQYFSVTDLP